MKPISLLGTLQKTKTRPIGLNTEYMVLLQEFKTGMMDHPVTAKIMREKTLDSLLATM